MVQAILEGRKTQTRRVLKNVVEGDNCTLIKKLSPQRINIRDPQFLKFCPYGQVGDRLWVRETWQFHDPLDVPKHRHGKVAPFVGCQGKRDINWVAVYRADGELADHPEFGKFLWQPSIFMPRWASRILLEITAIRVERLHDISEEDAAAEGVPCTELGLSDGLCKAQYFDLWESINGRESLDSNPWVWVITFKVVEIKQ